MQRAPHVPSGAASLEAAARVAVAALANHGPAAIYLDEAGEGLRLLAGEDLVGAGAATPEMGVPARAARGDQHLLILAPEAPKATLDLAAIALSAALDQVDADDRLRRVELRLAEGERIGAMGSFDWDLDRDVLVPSDELLRLFGMSRPGDVPAAFLDRVHPDDRPGVETAMQRSRTTGAPFEVELRVVHPDGEVRELWTYGEVALDPDGSPAHFTGVCRDVTDQHRYEREALAAAGRFEAMVAAAPDAIIVVDQDGTITAVNPQAVHLFGYREDQLLGLDVDALLPDALRDRHASLRRSYARDARARPMGAGLDLEARRADGSLVPVDIGLTPIEGEAGAAVAAFVRDATPRRQAEAERQRFAEGRIRRRQALELNDTVVQGLVALLWRLDDGEASEARRIAEATLAAARRIMSDLLSDDLEDLGPGHLVRSEHAGPSAPAAMPAPAAPPPLARDEPPAGRRSVLIADDAEDLRYLLRHRLEREGLDVVAEAADGQQAIDLTLHHRPDVVLLDLSMPVLDGLEAARRIRTALPTVRIVVLSGYPDDVMGARAVAAGADVYCEKTVTLEEVYEAVIEEPAPSSS